MTPADFLDWRAQNVGFVALAAAQFDVVTVTGTQEPERVVRGTVTPSYFPVLGMTPVLGRSLAPDSAGPAEVVISYGYWQRRFGAAVSVLGKTLVFDAHPFTIIGVAPAGWPGGAQLWTRLSLADSDETNRKQHRLIVYGRLKNGVTQERGRRELETIAQRLATSYPQTNTGWTVMTMPLLDQWLGQFRPALVMLLAAAGCVLLIGAANLANLFLVRFLARQREMALRAALGATRGRLVGELTVEAALLGLAAGALGIGVALAAVPGLRALAPQFLPRLSEVAVDGRVIAFCAVTSLATVFVFGVFPAWHTSRGNLAEFLKEGGRATGSAQRYGLQDGLVVLQVAIALVLLTGAGLLVESFDRFRRVDPGFRTDGLLTAEIDLPNPPYGTPERQAVFVESVAEQLKGQPGTLSASTSDGLPGLGGGVLSFSIIGDPAPGQNQVPTAWAVAASPDYFRTLGIQLRRGRGLLASDDYRAAKIAVVDDLMVQRFFQNRDPIGRRLTFSEVPDTLQIVGVVTSVKQGGPNAEDRPEIYVPMAQFPSTFAFVIVHTLGPPESETRLLKHVIAGLDRGVPVSDVMTMKDRMLQSVGTTRFASVLASLFAVVALILGAVGIYSVLAYIVSQRRREIAVRIAIGASRRDVMSDVLLRALVLTGIGIVLGSVAAWMLTKTLAALFVGVSPHDPRIFVGSALVFAVVALGAAAVPALRTTRIQSRHRPHIDVNSLDAFGSVIDTSRFGVRTRGRHGRRMRRPYQSHDCPAWRRRRGCVFVLKRSTGRVSLERADEWIT